jgi:hypothetical protein
MATVAASDNFLPSKSNGTAAPVAAKLVQVDVQ